MVTVLEVGTCFVHGGEVGAEKRGGLRCLSGGLLLGGSLEEFLKPNVVLSRFGKQGRRVLLVKQARVADSPVSDSHERFGTLRRNETKNRYCQKRQLHTTSRTKSLDLV